MRFASARRVDGTHQYVLRVNGASLISRIENKDNSQMNEHHCNFSSNPVPGKFVMMIIISFEVWELGSKQTLQYIMGKTEGFGWEKTDTIYFW